jgi:hypothetical protein
MTRLSQRSGIASEATGDAARHQFAAAAQPAPCTARSIRALIAAVGEIQLVALALLAATLRRRA